MCRSAAQLGSAVQGGAARLSRAGCAARLSRAGVYRLGSAVQGCIGSALPCRVAQRGSAVQGCIGSAQPCRVYRPGAVTVSLVKPKPSSDIVVVFGTVGEILRNLDQCTRIV